MEKKVLIKIILIIGIGLIIAGPILGYATDKVGIYTKKAETITETSDDELQAAFHRSFTLAKNQKAVIKFSVFYPNITARLKIFNIYYYEAQEAINSDPTGLAGEDFIYSTFYIGQSPSTSGATLITITEQGEVYIEFTGSRNGLNLISLPGRYVVVVYGVNSNPADDNVKFDIAIKVDGPGGTLSTIFIIAGIIILLCYALLLSYSYLNKLRRGR